MASIVALHADTGQYAWHYQATPGEEWDFDATQPITNADLSGFCAVPADCEATLMMVDFQTDAGS